MTEIDCDTRFHRSPAVLHSKMKDTILALAPDTGDCFTFAGPSSRLWELLEQPVSASEAASLLVEEFDVDFERCRSEVAAFIGRLLAEELVVIASEPA